jgi:hypothetical protein
MQQMMQMAASNPQLLQAMAAMQGMQGINGMQGKQFQKNCGGAVGVWFLFFASLFSRTLNSPGVEFAELCRAWSTSYFSFSCLPVSFRYAR